MSVHRVTDVIRTSTQSWENAAATAVKTAAGTLRDLRAAEEAEQDLHLEQGGEITFRTKLRLPFKHDIAYAHAHQEAG
jgi:dodecin